MELPGIQSPEAVREMRWAMRLSLVFGVVMLVGKSAAYLLTGSAAILSDAAESVIHVVAVGFAAFSLRLSLKPANQKFLYGYERISFFSAGFEGALIMLAAVYIIVAAVQKWLGGIVLQNLGWGTLFTLFASLLNAGLSFYLIRSGRRHHSIILEANGRHVLTDSWTSFGVVVGLVLVLWTGWKPFDPICAIAVALNILWSGGKLVNRSVTGLMDAADLEMGHALRQKLDALCAQLGLQYHGVRFRNTGSRVRIELHLLFPAEVTVGAAHRGATALEERLPEILGFPAEVVTHLESLQDHNEVHSDDHYTGKPS